MNLVKEVQDLQNVYRYAAGIKRMLKVWLEMAKRIEALEERLDAKERARGYVHFPDQDRDLCQVSQGLEEKSVFDSKGRA